MSFYELQPGDTGFNVILADGTIETDWIVAGLLHHQNRVRIFKRSESKPIMVMEPSQPLWEAWQNG